MVAAEFLAASHHALVAKYESRAPRYTSYPTAVQFGPTVTAATYAGWLSDLAPDKPVSVYVHVPFCERLCWYCGCNTRVVHGAPRIDEYVRGLISELALLERHLPRGLRVGDVHLGGGTPNILSRDNLTDLFKALRHVFQLGGEIAAELDPAVLTESWVKAAAFHGLTRASLGVQDLSPEVQNAVNRVLSFEDLARSVGWLRDAGIRSINFDLMYGLPQQTEEGILQTIDRALDLEPDRIALFGYAHVPWMKAHQQLIHEPDLPDACERLDQSLAAAHRLKAAGYVEIGLDHFARPGDPLAKAAATGDLHRNFQGYVAGSTNAVIGIGVSAISQSPQGYAQNAPAEVAWRRALNNDVLPIVRGVALTDDDRFIGEIIERLMCDLRVDLPALCLRHGRDIGALSYARAGLEAFVRDGLARDDEGVVSVMELGRPFVRAICALFDAYLEAGAARHSLVV